METWRFGKAGFTVTVSSMGGLVGSVGMGGNGGRLLDGGGCSLGTGVGRPGKPCAKACSKADTCGGLVKGVEGILGGGGGNEGGGPIGPSGTAGAGTGRRSGLMGCPRSG